MMAFLLHSSSTVFRDLIKPFSVLRSSAAAHRLLTRSPPPTTNAVLRSRSTERMILILLFTLKEFALPIAPLTMSRRISDYERRLQEALQRAERAERQQQLEQRAREQAEEQQQRAEEQQQRERLAREQAEEARERAEQRQRKTTLDEYLGACHDLSRSIRIETDPTSTTQGKVTGQYDRKYPKRIIPWDKSLRPDLFKDQTKEMDFPDLQENLWERFNQDPTFSSQQLFPSLNDLEHVKSTIKTISDEMGVRYYERDTVENMVRFGLEEVYKNKVLREEFRLRGDVKFGSHLNLGQEERSMEKTMQELTSLQLLCRGMPAIRPPRPKARQETSREEGDGQTSSASTTGRTRLTSRP